MLEIEKERIRQLEIKLKKSKETITKVFRTTSGKLKALITDQDGNKREEIIASYTFGE